MDHSLPSPAIDPDLAIACTSIVDIHNVERQFEAQSIQTLTDTFSTIRACTKREMVADFQSGDEKCMPQNG